MNSFVQKQKFLGALIFALAMMGTFKLTTSAWDGMITVSDLKIRGRSGRIPAAIHKDLDFSKLNGPELLSASQRRLLSAARIIKQSGGVGIEFGQFIIRAEDGQRQLACDYYDHVQVTLEADGMAGSGEKPMMKVEAPCVTAADITRTEAIRIPAQEIMESNPVDSDASFASAENTSFRFQNMNQIWPRSWAITSVRLFRENEPGREVIVDQSEMREISRKPLLIQFSQAEPTN